MIGKDNLRFCVTIIIIISYNSENKINNIKINLVLNILNKIENNSLL